ncbi:MAG TPA: thermonuclease family protein [Mariprofundaceae bacterium]|nr:thermonuclease family protein [Mariprofundaceae bacterium]
MRFSTARLLALCICLFWAVSTQAGTLSVVEQGRWVTVSHVYDGDTFRSSRGERVRLLGINAPEVAHNDQPGQPLGKTAGLRLAKLIAGKAVQLRLDRDKKDAYGRTLAQVYLPDGTWVNELLVREGMAQVYTFAPNFRWTASLVQAEKLARSKELGIWHDERFRVLAAQAVSNRHVGQFRVIEGRVGRTGSWKFRLGRLHVSVPRKYRQWFGKMPKLTSGRSVIVHGTVRTSGQGTLFLALHSPYDLELTAQR